MKLTETFEPEILNPKSKQKQGWMYGCGFADLDGHRWNVLYMDFSKLPQH